MPREIPQKVIPATTARLRRAEVDFDAASGDAVRIVARYSDGQVIEVVPDMFDLSPAGSPKTWQKIGERLRDDLDGADTDAMDAHVRTKQAAREAAQAALAAEEAAALKAGTTATLAE